jgi:hypothetical protein
MHTALRLVLAVLGLVLVGVGLTAAVIVGDDDTVFTEPTAVDTGGTPIATVPDLFSYRGLDLTVRASSPGGVFLATGNPVDVADYLEGRAFYEVEEITRTGPRGESLDVEREPVEVAPEKATFWSDAEQGDGTRSLTLAVDGQPDRVIVAPLGKGPVTLSFGATLDGLFALAVAVAILGLALLLLAIFLVIRARRRRASHSVAAAPDEARTAQPLARVAVLALVVPLVGCGSVPERVDYEAPTKAALTEAEVPAMLADYDKRNNAAIKAAQGPRFDTSKWQDADAGPLLDADVFSTFYDSVVKEKGRSIPLEHDGEGVLAGQFAEYPMWAIVPTDTSYAADRLNKQTPKEKREDDRYVSLSLFTRESAVAGWRQALRSSVEVGDVPTAVDDAQILTGRDLVDVKEAVARQQRFLETGKGSWPADETTQGLRSDIVEAEKVDHIARAFYTIAPLNDETHRLFALEVEGGVLALASYAVRFHQHARPGNTIFWKAPYDAIRTHGSERDLVIPRVATTAILVPDEGSATPLGTTWREILTSSSDGIAAGR